MLHARARLASVVVSTALAAALVGTSSAHATEVTPDPTATDTTTTTTVTTDPTATAVEPVSTTTLATTSTTAAATVTTTTVKPALTLAQRRAIVKAKERAKAVRVAKAQVGDSYVAGRSGPNAFDCSGLALYVTKKATGRALPHYSKAQYKVTKRVSKRGLKPGDLVFFFRHGAHHVGVYIGHGKMVHAANPRADVRIDYVFRGWYGQHYSGAGRVI